MKNVKLSITCCEREVKLRNTGKDQIRLFTTTKLLQGGNSFLICQAFRDAHKWKVELH